jgi:hypothetical protein
MIDHIKRFLKKEWFLLVVLVTIGILVAIFEFYCAGC